MTSQDPRRAFLRSLSGELPGSPLERRRVVKELATHLDDAVAEFQALGVPADLALERALGRLGDPTAIAAAFRATRVERRALSRGGRLRSPAWIAVAAMSLVTAWAAEVPPSSGAKPPASCASTLRHSDARALRFQHPRAGWRGPAGMAGGGCGP